MAGQRNKAGTPKSRDIRDQGGSGEEVELVTFRGWRSDPAGYQLSTVKRGKLWNENFLPTGALMVEGKSGRLTDYELLPNDPVHRYFSEAGDEPADIIGFVDSYGLPEGGVRAALRDLIRIKRHITNLVALVERANGERGPGAVNSVLAVEDAWSEIGRPRLAVQLEPVIQDDGAASVVFRVMPDTLLEYMKLQAVHELQGRVSWRRCAVCGKWMPVGGGHGRSDKTTCSERCRKRKQRQS
jgi:hypothetical protein